MKHRISVADGTAVDRVVGSDDDDAKHHRLVILVGPHKSASSSVQEFFFRYASSRDEQRLAVPALANWSWPYNRKRRLYRGPKAFAALVKEATTINRDFFVPHVYQSIRDALQTQLRLGLDSFQIVMGTEEFDRFGTTPWSHWDGIQAIHELVEVVASDIHNMTAAETQQATAHHLHVEFVVNYRRPRSDHWISIWKQLTRKHQEQGSPEREYRSFLCSKDNDSMIWEYLDAAVNPLGLTMTLSEQSGQIDRRFPGGRTSSLVTSMNRIHLMDMQGIINAGLDISHAVACEVLNAEPCPGGWLEVTGQERAVAGSLNHNNTAIKKNQRAGDARLSTEQFQEMEWLLRLRDCEYQRQFEMMENQHHLVLHHGENMWDDCIAREIQLWGSITSDNLLGQLRAQVGCGSEVTTGGKAMRSDPSLPSLMAHLDQMESDRKMAQIAKIQTVSVLSLGLGFLLWFSPRYYGWMVLPRGRAISRNLR